MTNPVTLFQKSPSKTMGCAVKAKIKTLYTFFTNEIWDYFKPSSPRAYQKKPPVYIGWSQDNLEKRIIRPEHVSCTNCPYLFLRRYSSPPPCQSFRSNFCTGRL